MFHYHLALSQLFPSGLAVLHGFLSCPSSPSIPWTLTQHCLLPHACEWARWLAPATHLSPLSYPASKYYNSSHCLRLGGFILRAVTLQNAARISPCSRVYITSVSFILPVLQNTEGWTVTSRLPPFILLPQNHMQVLVLSYQHLSSLPDVSFLRTERRMPWRVWHIVGTY